MSASAEEDSKSNGASGEFDGPNRRSDERRRKPERRGPAERRVGLDRRRGPGRRRADVRRSAEEGEITDDLLEFIMTIDEYKRVNNKPFPSWSEVYEVIKYLGYRKTAPKAEHIDRPAPDS